MRTNPLKSLFYNQTSWNETTTMATTTTTSSDFLTLSPQEKDELLDEMLACLDQTEMEVAAKASFEYFSNPDPSQTEFYARQFAWRYLEAKEGDVEAALQRLQDTLQFRKEMDVDCLRQAFDDGKHTKTKDSDHDGLTMMMRRNRMTTSRLEKEIRQKNVYVQGYDKQGHSTYIFVPRNACGHDKEWTLKQHVYTMERAVACSRAESRQVNAVVDFTGFSMFQHAPPLAVGKAFLTVLRKHYVGRIHKIYIVNPPTAFFYLWKVFGALVGTKTRAKICLVQTSSSSSSSSSSSCGDNELARAYNANQAASWMMSGGTKNRPLDVAEYLYHTPFYRSFDDDEEEEEK